MGLFDLFKKAPPPPPPPKSLPQLCHGMAYSFLPPLVFADDSPVIGYFTTHGNATGTYLYTLVCQSQHIVPAPDHADQFRSHTGNLSDGTAYYVVEYPVPPPVNPDLMKAVLAPYFSAILHSLEAGETYYFILGQGPRGGTTLRKLTMDGTNWNLGHGPAPELNAFLKALEKTKVPPTLGQITIDESDEE